MALRLGARWLAFTDADLQVAPDWLVRQMETRKQLVCGTVEVTDWLDHTPLVQAAYLRAYEQHDGHRHVHGANLGMSAETYLAVGGFPSLPCHEDVGLVAAAQALGIEVAWTASPKVVTSARRAGRVAGGFATYLSQLDRCASEAISKVSPCSPHAAA
jgi:hypothetical protein